MVRPATMIRAIVIWPLALTALFGVDSRVLAQGETTAAILGQVSDSSNAALQGATVTVTNRDRGLK
ncbi:MAG: hypothetical protein WA207_00685, partial [Candidatus Acidiferrum sp.]